MPCDAGQREDRGGDRIGADRHAADEVGHVAGEQFEHPFADQPRALGIERDLPAIEVVLGLLARGEREVAELQRLCRAPVA